MKSRWFVVALTLAAIVASSPTPVFADYPDKPIKIVIPYAPSVPDAFGRLLADRLGKALKQPVIVENKPGAGGGVGAQAVARAPADGYTLLFCGGSMFLVNPWVYAKPIYERSQFSPIAQIAEVPFVFIARKDLPASSLSDLSTLMRAEPGKIKFGVPSLGSQFQMLWEQYKILQQVTDTPIMVGQNLMTTVLNGDVDVTVLTPGPLVQYFEQGQLKALAVTGGRRLSKLPNVQTVSEAGLPALDNVADYFLMAPKGTPQPIIDRLVREINLLATDGEYITRLADLFATPGRTKNPAEFDRFLDEKSKEWSEIVKRSGVSIQ